MVAVPMFQPAGLLLKVLPFVLGAMIFAGLLSFHIAIMLPRPTPGAPPLPVEIVDYVNTVRTLGYVAAVLLDAAAGFTVAFTLFVGIARPDISEGARRGAIILGAIFLVVWVLFGLMAFSIFRFI